MERITRDNSAICLVDHQVGLLSGVRDITVNELKHNVVGLAKAARILGIPTIASTTAKDVFWGPTFPELVEGEPARVRIGQPPLNFGDLFIRKAPGALVRSFHQHLF